MALPDGEVIPIKWVDLKLYQHGECGQAPRDYAFQYQAGDDVYTVQVGLDMKLDIGVFTSDGALCTADNPRCNVLTKSWDVALASLSVLLGYSEARINSQYLDVTRSQDTVQPCEMVGF